MKIVLLWIVAASWLVEETALAEEPAPLNVTLATVAARRFPQPVRVGDLIRRPILQPLETRPLLGHVQEIVRSSAGDAIVMRYGGLLGFGGRYIAVPTVAMALLGSELEILDFTPEQLAAFPTYNARGAVRLGGNEVIYMGLARPSH